MMQSLGSKQRDVDDFVGDGAAGGAGAFAVAVPATQDEDAIKIIRWAIPIHDYHLSDLSIFSLSSLVAFVYSITTPINQTLRETLSVLMEVKRFRSTI